MGLIFSHASSGTQVVIIGNNVEEESGCNKSSHVYCLLTISYYLAVCMSYEGPPFYQPSSSIRVPRDVMQVLVDFQNLPSHLKNIKK